MSVFHKQPDLFFPLILILLVLGITLPFLNHAYHIDETLFLRIAQQIKEHPFNPYGFWYLWNFKYEPMHQIAAFPPVFSYYLAAVSLTYRFPPEWLVHLSLVPFAVLAVISTYILARQFEFSPVYSFVAACLMAVSPAFVLSANLAMPDVAAAALGIFSVVLAIQGWRKNKIGYLIASGLVLGLASLMRYNAFPLTLIIFLLGLTYSSWKRAILPSLGSAAIVVFWVIGSQFITGESHTAEVFSVFAKTEGWKSRFWSMGIHLTLTTFLPFIALLLLRNNKLFWTLLLVFVGIDFGLYAGKGIKRFALFPDVLFFILGLGLLVFLAIFFFQQVKALELGKISSSQDKTHIETRLSLRKFSTFQDNTHFRYAVLFVWILAILCIPLIYVHFAPKYLLLAQPAMILILLYGLKSYPALSKKALPILFSLMLIFSLSVANADFEFANNYRDEAERISKNEIAKPLAERKSPIKMVWFTGHWGWQYYMEKWGAMAMPLFNAVDGGPTAGDLVVTSEYASANELHPDLEKKLKLIQKDIFTLPNPLRTMNPIARVGFYSNHWGPLPFNLSKTPTEKFKIYRVMPETKMVPEL